MKCPACGYDLDKCTREGQAITCPSCNQTIHVHYTLKEQLRDPCGLLLRDPKYVRISFRVAFAVAFVLLVAFIVLRLIFE